MQYVPPYQGWRKLSSTKCHMRLPCRATAASLRGLRSSSCKSHAEADWLPGLAKRMTDMAPTNSNCRNLSLPALLILPRRCLPPVECSFGVRPSQAAKCRPDAKFPGSTVKARVIAPNGPTPGILTSNWLTGLALCSAASSPSRAATR